MVSRDLGGRLAAMRAALVLLLVSSTAMAAPVDKLFEDVDGNGTADAVELGSDGTLTIAGTPVKVAPAATRGKILVARLPAGAQLVVTTSVAALDDVFACCDQSAPQILVDPSHAERVVALGRAVMLASGSRVRELSHDDRVTLLRLTEQVDQIVDRLGRLAVRPFSGPGTAPAPRFESPRQEFGAPAAVPPCQ